MNDKLEDHALHFQSIENGIQWFKFYVQLELNIDWGKWYDIITGLYDCCRANFTYGNCWT